MLRERRGVIVFAAKDLHPFYRVFAAQMGFAKVCSFENGLDEVLRTAPELVLIDGGHRINRGLRFLREIKAAASGTIVVIVTEKSSEETVLEAFESGARCYVRKPVSASHLRRISHELLKLKIQAKERRTAYIAEGRPFKAAAGDIRQGQPANLLRSAEFIEENLGEAIDLDACARAGSLSKFQFCRAFRRHFGMSPMRFVTFRRIERAKALLARDDLNMTEIAWNVGFRNYGTFIKAFRNHTGVLPKKFRKSVRPRRLF